MFKRLLVTCFIGATNLVSAQLETNSDLYKTILSKNNLLFQVGFNTCDIAQFDSLLSEYFEFFHDKDSISTRKEFLNGIRNGLCKSPSTYQSRRELIPGSTEIFPLYKNGKLYGAIQHGKHHFYENSQGKPERFASTARFTHVWILENGLWKLSKGLSYDHQN
jgi:hypothetical protein